MATNNKPANQLRCGNIKATIWQNVSEKGRISPERGAMGLRLASMTLMPLSRRKHWWRTPSHPACCLRIQWQRHRTRPRLAVCSAPS